MRLNVLRFVAAMLTAVAMAAGFAHLLAQGALTLSLLVHRD
jgi:hypothetical protein